MTADQGFKLHPGAASDITGIWEFIAEGNPDAAGRVREDILDAIRRLVPFPHQGHQRTDLTSRPLRFRTVRNYLIAYAPDERPLLIIAVLHGRHNCCAPWSPQPSRDRGHSQRQEIAHRLEQSYCANASLFTTYGILVTSPP